MKQFNSKTPICSFLFVLLIIIFSLYFTTAIKNIPCEKNLSSIFLSNFVHVNFYHLLSNLVGIYSLSIVEERLGYKNFLSLLIFILVFNTAFEAVLHKFIDTPCSIGFSAVLFGFLSFDFVKEKRFDYRLMISVILHLISTRNDKSISMQGHIVGIVSGIIAGLLYREIDKNLRIKDKEEEIQDNAKLFL